MQPEAYRVAAIVSTYKSERFMRGCLEDLVNQTLFPQTEVMVIDSASPENEAAIVHEFQERYANIRYIRTDQRETLYAAWNRAIGLSTAPYLTNANTDDRHAPEALAKLTAVLDQRPEVHVVYAETAITDEPNSSFAKARIIGEFKARRFDRRRLFRDCLPGPQPMWRRSLHEQFGLFDPNFTTAGDYEFWLRISREVKFACISERLGLFLDSPGSIMHSDMNRTERESELAREKHWPAEWGKRTPYQRPLLDRLTRRSTYEKCFSRLFRRQSGH